jgi:hypothetical protein
LIITNFSWNASGDVVPGWAACFKLNAFPKFAVGVESYPWQWGRCYVVVDESNEAG